MKGRNAGHTGVGPSFLNFQGSLGTAKTVFRYPDPYMQMISNLSSVHLCYYSKAMFSKQTASLASLPGDARALSVDGVMIQLRNQPTSDYRLQIY